MRLHRFYVNPTSFQLKHDFWLHDDAVLHQWNKVLRYQSGQQVVLFDGIETERLYEITELKADEAHLNLITDFERQLPQKDIYLMWSLLKKDKNDWVLQKATELGVSHFVPLLAERSERADFDVERAQKIVIEAAEQCGRSDIPSLRDPMLVKTAVEHMKSDIQLFICEQGNSHVDTEKSSKIGLLIGPEGGWSDQEKQLFTDHTLAHIGLGTFTLRAETAAIVASSKAQGVYGEQ